VKQLANPRRRSRKWEA